MARAALVALAWAAAAAAALAARYVDYSGVKMPQYGPGDYDSGPEPALSAAAADDYHGHSPDASASLDYQFEENVHGKTERPPKELDERESWSKYSRRHRELERFQDDETLDKYDSELEDNSKIKLNRRPSVVPRRPRQKIKKYKKESSQRRLVKYKRGRSDSSDSDRDYYHGSKEETHDISDKDTEDKVDGYRHTKVTERIVRRKQRDRHMRGRLEDEREIREDTLGPNRRIKSDQSTEPEYVLRDEGSERTNDRELYRPLMEVDDAEVTRKRNNKAYDNYGDYYDMKRVHSIKNKLPTLLRRTSTRVASPTVTSIDVLDALWAHRRTASAVPVPPAPPASGLAALSVVPLPPSSTASTSLAVTTSATNLIMTTSRRVPPPNASDQISLAEKSRLSILKKAQRKESVRSESSTMKPPVLLQVTDKRLTVVVVEPPSSEGPWMRAREVAHDTPERVDRAKLLMRRKLVARAKNIQELTDNWDEMVCDYIDVSLLDASPPSSYPAYLVLILAFLFLGI